MKSVSVAVYSFNIQNNESQMLDLNTIEDIGLEKIFKSFMKDNKNKFEDIPNKEKVFKAESYKRMVETDDNNRKRFTFLFGKIKTGGYGTSSEIIDSETGEINYTKGETEAEVLPFSFCMAIPAGNSSKGIMILQTIGVFSMKSIFEFMFEKKLKSYNNEYNFITGNLAPKAYVENYMDKGILQKIRMIKYEIPNDREKKVANGYKCAARELVIHKPIGFIRKNRNKVSKFLSGQSTVCDIMEIEGFEFDNLKFDFKLGKKNKTINLSNLSKLVITEDITDQIAFNSGFPTDDSIEEAIKSIAEDYMISMGVI